MDNLHRQSLIVSIGLYIKVNDVSWLVIETCWLPCVSKYSWIPEISPPDLCHRLITLNYPNICYFTRLIKCNQFEFANFGHFLL